MAKKEKTTTATKKQTTKKETTRKESSKEIEVYFQYESHETKQKDLSEKIERAYKEAGHKDAIKHMDIYVKPEENAAYYVINENETGKVDLF